MQSTNINPPVRRRVLLSIIQLLQESHPKSRKQITTLKNESEKEKKSGRGGLPWGELGGHYFWGLPSKKWDTPRESSMSSIEGVNYRIAILYHTLL